jgi:hypothetical protein
MAGTVDINRTEYACAAGCYAEEQSTTPPKDAEICCDRDGMCLKGQTRDEILFMELYVDLLRTNVPETKVSAVRPQEQT